MKIKYLLNVVSIFLSIEGATSFTAASNTAPHHTPVSNVGESSIKHAYKSKLRFSKNESLSPLHMVAAALTSGGANEGSRLISNRATGLLRRLDTTIESSPVAADAVLSLLSVLSGGIIGSLVLLAKKFAAHIDVSVRAKQPKLTPLLGSVIICALYFIRADIASGPKTIFSDDEKSFSPARQALRLLAVIVTVGSGCAMAFAGPAAELGMTVARLVGLNFLPAKPQSQHLRRSLFLAGAGAGLAANFDTPFAGVFYALEVARPLLPSGANKEGTKASSNSRSEITAILLGTAASAYVCRRGLLGSAHFLSKNIYHLGFKKAELGLFCVLGVLSGVAAALYDHSKRHLSQLFSAIPTKLRPLLGGASCSAAAQLGSPSSLSLGFNYMSKIASGQIEAPVPIAKYMFGRGLLLSICSSSGLIGGQFAPALFIGAALGWLTQFAASRAGVSFVLSSGSTYAAIGAAGAIAAIFRAPLTACVLLLELSRNLDLTIPLGITTALAALVSQFLLP